MSTQGLSGILDTPNAEVIGDGTFSFLYHEQRDSVVYPRENTRNYLLTFGALPFLEVSGRVSDFPNISYRDLAASFKLQLPLFRLHRLLPAVAVGAQDLAGSVPMYRTRFVVVTEQLAFLRVSAGWGSGPDRLEGAFGGLELRVADWGQLLAEYDSELKLGARLALPVQILSSSFRLGVQARSSVEQPRRVALAFSFSGWLGQDRRVPADPMLGEIPAISDTDSDAIDRLHEALCEAGLSNVRLGRRADATLVVAYENARFHHSELDALGVVLGLVATRSSPGFARIAVQPRRTNLALLEISAPTAVLRTFFEAGAVWDDEVLAGALAITPDLGPVEWLTRTCNPKRLRPQLVIEPGVTTFLATDQGVFDYVLEVRPEVILDLWQGAALAARFAIPLVWSDQFDQGRDFRVWRKDPRTEHALLYQGVRAAPALFALIGAGLHDDRGAVLAEALWHPGFGSHRLRFYGELAQGRHGDRVTSAVGAYELWLPGDASLALAGGRYLGDDKAGFSVELKRFFGDTSLGFYYRHASLDFAGIQLALPLTPRRDMHPRYGQIRGSAHWSYEQGTRINGFNAIMGPTITLPHTSYTLDQIYFDSARLRADYLRDHLSRLREAYRLWVRNAEPLPQTPAP